MTQVEGDSGPGVGTTDGLAVGPGRRRETAVEEGSGRAGEPMLMPMLMLEADADAGDDAASIPNNWAAPILGTVSRPTLMPPAACCLLLAACCCSSTGSAHADCTRGRRH